MPTQWGCRGVGVSRTGASSMSVGAVEGLDLWQELEKYSEFGGAPASFPIQQNSPTLTSLTGRGSRQVGGRCPECLLPSDNVRETVPLERRKNLSISSSHNVHVDQLLLLLWASPPALGHNHFILELPRILGGLYTIFCVLCKLRRDVRSILQRCQRNIPSTSMVPTCSF